MSFYLIEFSPAVLGAAVSFSDALYFYRAMKLIYMSIKKKKKTCIVTRTLKMYVIYLFHVMFLLDVKCICTVITQVCWRPGRGRCT